LGVFAARDLKVRRGSSLMLKELSVCFVDTNSCFLPVLTDGMIDSFALVPSCSTVQYMAGPGALLNGACEHCSNAKLRFSTGCVVLKEDVMENEEIEIVYGNGARDNLKCLCGENLVNHLSIEPQFQCVHPQSQDGRLSALQTELNLLKNLTVMLQLDNQIKLLQDKLCSGK